MVRREVWDVRARTLADHDGLQHPELAHGVHELGELLLAELGARLLRVRDDVARGDRGESGTGNGRELGRVGRRREEDVDGAVAIAVAHGDERADAAPESCALGGHYCPAPL